MKLCSKNKTRNVKKQNCIRHFERRQNQEKQYAPKGMRRAVEKQENSKTNCNRKVIMQPTTRRAVKNKRISKPKSQSQSHYAPENMVCSQETKEHVERRKGQSKRECFSLPRYTPARNGVAEKQVSMSEKLQSETRYTPGGQGVAEKHGEARSESELRNGDGER